MATGQDNLALAFILVTVAGLATALGASLVLFRGCVVLANKRVLAGALSLSAGVMLYVSFVEIFQKSLAGFHEAGVSGDTGSGLVYGATTLCFFGGILLMMLLDKLVHFCVGAKGHPQLDDITFSPNLADKSDKSSGGALPRCSRDIEVVASQSNSNSLSEASKDVDMESGTKSNDLALGSDDVKQQGNRQQLNKMGLLTALAIGLHNFPEGLATFVATLSDPKVGAALAVAIGIHNIPEGLCVSIPVYYSTGSRLKGVMWALLSGVSEPLGALLGYLVLMNHFGPMAYGILFGLIGGMMVYICLHELIPTAHRYDPHDTVSTFGIVIGMLVMALSLVLFVMDPAPAEEANQINCNTTS